MYIYTYTDVLHIDTYVQYIYSCLYIHTYSHDPTCHPSQHASQETWKPPASTLAHRLAVIHPTSGCVGPKGLSNQVNAATRCRSGWTRQAPHTRPAVCEQTSHKLQQTTLDLFVGRAKASRETTPMSSRAQPDTVFASLILMLLFLAV